MAELSLERVRIDGFRGLRGLDLDGLGRVNILVGANDSGKTSVLEALSVLCKPFDPREWHAMVRRRDFGGLDETIIHSLRWCFTQSSGLSEPEDLFSSRCEFACDGQFPLRKLAVAYHECIDQRAAVEEYLSERLYPAPLIAADVDQVTEQSVSTSLRSQQGAPPAPIAAKSPPPRQGQGTFLAADLINDVTWDCAAGATSSHGNRPPDGQVIAFRIWEDGLGRSSFRGSSASLMCESLTPYSHQINRFQVRPLSKQIIRDESDQALDMLQSFDPDVMAVQVLSLRGDRPAIYLKHRRLGWAPLSVFGDAMRRCVLLAATLPRLKDGGLLLIDEVETGIHVKALGRVFQWLIESARQLNVQVFVTTHSLEALDAIILAPSAQDGDVVAFQLSRTDESTVAKRYAGDLLKRLRQQRGLDLR